MNKLNRIDNRINRLDHKAVYKHIVQLENLFQNICGTKKAHKLKK